MGDHVAVVDDPSSGVARSQGVPRTATITAVEETVLLALAREEFLDADTGEGEARRLAEDVVVGRLRA